MRDQQNQNSATQGRSELSVLVSRDVEAALVKRGVFKGAHGLVGLLNAQEFWDRLE